MLGGSVATAKPGGIYYNTTNDFIAFTSRNYDNDNNPAGDGDNSFALARFSRKRDYDDNRIQVGGSITIQSLAKNVTVNAEQDVKLAPNRNIILDARKSSFCRWF